ncbi:MAG: DUF4252 domain-containing protein [Rikenellaceae bacterium]
MKRILSIFCFFIFSVVGFAQEKTIFENNKMIMSEFVDSYRNYKDVKIVEVGSAMTEMLAAKLIESGNESNARLLRSIESITIIADGGIDSQLQEGMFNLPKKCVNYKLISSINDKGKSSAFYFATHAGIKKCEFLMLVKSDEKNILLYIVGEFSIKDISALSELSEGMSTKK